MRRKDNRTGGGEEERTIGQEGEKRGQYDRRGRREDNRTGGGEEERTIGQEGEKRGQ